MTYEIGQRVTTPLGLVGEIKQSGDEMSKVAIKSVDGIYTYFYKFMNKKLKPYKTPHERLIEMGFEVLDITHYANRDFTHYVHSKSGLCLNFQTKNRYYYIATKSLDSPNISLELSRIITDCLEWLGEEKWKR